MNLNYTAEGIFVLLWASLLCLGCGGSDNEGNLAFLHSLKAGYLQTYMASPNNPYTAILYMKTQVSQGKW